MNSVKINQARTRLEAARAASEKLRSSVAVSQRHLRELGRRLSESDPALKAAADAHAEHVRSLADAVQREREAQAVLDDMLRSSLPADGAADFASLSASFPIVLLPIRIETRFVTDGTVPTALRVRIYPDELIADTHEAPLTDAERDAGINYWRSGWAREREKEAWRALVASYPAPRAAWIVRTLRPTNLASRPAGAPVFPDSNNRAANWTRAAETRVLPDRWMVIGYQGGQEVARAVGQPIRDPLPLSLNPSAEENTDTIDISADGLKLDDDIAWMVDFRRAVRAGMALTLTPSGVDLSRGFDRLIVIGVKSSLPPDKIARRLTQLLDAHHYTKGLAFVRQGTPTNNTTDAPSGFPVIDDDGSRSFAVERGSALTGRGRNGTLFTRALGVAESVAGHLDGSDLEEEPNARAMNEALWPVTWRYFLDQMMDPIATDAAIATAREHFVNYVRGRGPLSAFRTGATPYGLLPVSSLLRWTTPDTAGPLERHLLPLLLKMREIWMEAVPRVPRMGATTSPDDDLVAVLGMEASTREAWVRAALGPEVQNQLFAEVQMFIVNWWLLQHAVIQSLMTRLGHPEWDPRIGNMTFSDTAQKVGVHFVAPPPLSETEPLQPFNYINWIRTADLKQLQEEQLPAGVSRPNALLYLLLRHGALSLYASIGTQVAIKNNLASRPDRLEPELPGVTTGAPPRLTPLQLLSRPIPQGTATFTVAHFVLSEEPTVVESTEVPDFRAALEHLEKLPVAELERLFTETLDTCSHRLDAWITSLATKRLEEMRQANPTGSHLGAFGWVEDLRPDTTRPGIEPATSGGYIHAPSASHAAAAAILRNGYLTRSGQNSERYAIDLSSARVRSGLELLDAVRQGQPLGAVLGYRFERGLHEGHRPLRLEKYIDPFRQLFPIVADKNAVSGEPTESIAARNVVDGLLLRSAWHAGTIPWGQRGLPIEGSDRAAIEAELNSLDDAVDSVADVLTSESVFQLVRGNASNAASVLDSISQGLRPPEPEIAIQPRAGTALTHRVAVVLGSEPLAAAAWSAVPLTPRALVEPFLDAWVGSLLGDPANVRCRVSFRDQANALTTRTVQLSELELRPLDVLALTKALDARPGTSELEARVGALLPQTAAGVDVQFAADPSWDRAVLRTFPDVLEVARAINALLSSSRALDPKDLLPPDESQAADTADRLPLEAAERAARAEAALIDARSRLQAGMQGPSMDADVLRDGLRAASLLGVATAFPGRPDAGADELATRAENVLSELDRRASAAAAATTAADKVRAVFQQHYFFLPRFICANAGELELARAQGAALVGTPAAVTKWMQQASRVRAPLASWRRLSLLTGALGHTPLAFDVAQLPHAPNARWVGLAFASEEDRPESGRLSLVIHHAAKPPASVPWAGLLLDEWRELIPARAEDTAIAFHYDDPGAEAAQAVLVAVPPTQAAAWDLTTLLDILNETIDLAKMRAVDSELLPFGQLLPAIFLATNPSNETVATDLHPVLVNASAVIT